ncbi:MAG: PepSY domain-containing protein [Comamonadaceae bacterium]|nr:PepSY domain-containing protein [Pseudomonadota bacterium]MDE2414354.1 PepSY domain-containing protein [Comamonadaceae bacterium]
MNALAALLLALSLGAAAVPARADADCEAPVARWQPREAVLQHAARQGWQVQRLKIDDGCYEIRGQDAQGRAFKARLDPETLRVLRLKWRDGEPEHERRRERRRGQTE